MKKKTEKKPNMFTQYFNTNSEPERGKDGITMGWTRQKQ